VVRAWRAVALVAVLALPLLASGGVGAAGTKKGGLDLSSPAAIQSYLVSKGINPATVTWQTGTLNYAGPSCPGIGWNCTTSTQVVQLATPGGQNKFECEPEEDQVLPTDEDTNTCVIAQSGDNNKARCKLGDTDESTTQTCVIGQDGERNSADIDMSIDQKTGSDQDANQMASVEQNADERNQSQVHQTVRQRSSWGSSQTQEAYQLADVSQVANGSDNFSHVHQSQDQDESGNATTQDQNTSPQPSCFAKDANQCALVLQDNGGGKNESHLHQAIGERQSTKAPAATQTQGDLDNGNEGDIHQVNPDGVGENDDHAHQVVAQRQSGPNGTTSQEQNTDPRCCGDSQVGAKKNREFIHHATTQSASEEYASQYSQLWGEVHQVSDPANSCKIDQHARNNTDSSHESVSGTDLECGALFLITTCTNGGEVEGCTSTQEPCDVIDCDLSVDSLLPVLSLPTSPTFGRDIAMPSYTSEPADYVDPGGWW
jgi:hypothetical protein